MLENARNMPEYKADIGICVIYHNHHMKKSYQDVS